MCDGIEDRRRAVFESLQPMLRSRNLVDEQGLHRRVEADETKLQSSRQQLERTRTQKSRLQGAIEPLRVRIENLQREQAALRDRVSSFSNRDSIDEEIAVVASRIDELKDDNRYVVYSVLMLERYIDYAERHKCCKVCNRGISPAELPAFVERNTIKKDEKKDPRSQRKREQEIARLETRLSALRDLKPVFMRLKGVDEKIRLDCRQLEDLESQLSCCNRTQEQMASQLQGEEKLLNELYEIRSAFQPYHSLTQDLNAAKQTLHKAQQRCRSRSESVSHNF